MWKPCISLWVVLENMDCFLFWFLPRPSLVPSEFKIPKYQIGFQTTFPHLFVQCYANIINEVKSHKNPRELSNDASHILQSLAEFVFLPALYQYLAQVFDGTQLWLLLSHLFHLLFSCFPADKPLYCATLISALVPLNCFSYLPASL